MEEREYEFGLDSFMAITAGPDGEPIGGDQVVRDTSPVRPSSRPDLDRDVKQGIQSQQINKELFKR